MADQETCTKSGKMSDSCEKLKDKTPSNYLKVEEKCVPINTRIDFFKIINL